MAASLLPLAGIAIIFGAGVPRWVIGYLRSRRLKAFLSEFPNALDVMVRSIKSGLPLNDAIRMISAEGQEPVRTEFKRIVEAQQMGMNVPEACGRLYNRIPLSEANFFAIVIAIQAQAGGNLSEALGNLSRVLRDRKKMKAKINALSMEAKASAAIIGALPFIVAALVYLTSPDYIMILFTDSRSPHSRCFGDLDVDRHSGDAQHDQLRHLGADKPCFPILRLPSPIRPTWSRSLSR
jgi:tight adherence protein B